MRARAKQHKTGEMNRGESMYRAHLAMRKVVGEIAEFRFESIKLRLADNTYYTPDFDVQLADGTIEFHEVKGRTMLKRADGSKVEGAWSHEDAKLKIKVAAEMFPEFGFCIVFPSKQGGWTRVDY
jgi:hypothetical protein